jgi:DNA-3-methyladenine glycosylase
MNPLQCSLECLRRADLPVGTMELAQYLIGKTLVHNLPTARLSGVIVETEGYPPGDAAGHAFRGKTRGNQSLFLGRGYCYVYFTYGSSFMVNVTSEEPGVGAGVLLRALEPLEGIEIMQRFRKTTRTRDIARGPGRLAQAMQIDKRYDGVDLCAGEALWLGTAARRIGPICSSTRIRLTREVHRKRRFFESGTPMSAGRGHLPSHERSGKVTACPSVAGKNFRLAY